MVLTQEAVEAAVSAPGLDPSDPAVLGSTIASASLMGARGNSGVILSQVLRSISGGVAFPPGDQEPPVRLAAALDRASTDAHRAVARPAEGTVLSVLRDAARAGSEAARGGADSEGVLEAALTEARESLRRTKDVLPALKQAGVVDAGGKGIVLLIDAILAAVRDERPSEPVGPLGPVGGPTEESVPEEGLAFEVQYLLEANDEGVPALRRTLGALGDSLVVVGGGGLFNVHVHTDEPGRAIEAALDSGRPRNISVVHLQGQVTNCLGGQARAVRVAEQSCALVAVAEGEGLTQTYRSLGAVVVPGGPGNNPAVADLLGAVEAAPAEAVIVLPNHRNVGPAAERAAAESGKDARVVRTRSAVSGLVAATAFNPLAPIQENVAAMQEAIASARSAELAPAERDARTPAGPVRRGEWLALVDGEAVTVGGSAADSALAVARRLVGEGSEILTLVVGAQASDGDRDAVREALADAFPELVLEVMDGGQPRYPFLIGVE
jgi:DAK2 domain fusion protein YloV